MPREKLGVGPHRLALVAASGGPSPGSAKQAGRFLGSPASASRRAPTPDPHKGGRTLRDEQFDKTASLLEPADVHETRKAAVEQALPVH